MRNTICPEKNIAPVCGHGGGGLGQSLSFTAKLAPESKVLTAFSARFDGGGSLEADLSRWLEKVS
ncbi:MAG: hypothetical protein LBR53_03475 [Deltaproteobacteria bacterium]|nr:hypothetical protein [Deltaproteobacteria bacterium]